MRQTDVCLRRPEARQWLKDLTARGWFMLWVPPPVKPAEMIKKREISFKVKNESST